VKNVKKEVFKMPRGDGTGPAGFGPMTGRAAGFCAGYNTPGYMNPAGGRGYGFGRGFGRGLGRGWGRGYGRGRWSGYAAAPGWYGGFYPAYAPAAYPNSPDYSASEEKAVLSDQVKALQEDLEAMNKRLKELDEEAQEKS
jgi:hypothetical protein